MDFEGSTLIAQAALLAGRRISSVDAVRASLDRIDASQSTLNAFRLLRRDAALAEAADADRRLAAGDTAPLLGVPIAVKDDVDVAGEPTAFGCGGYFPPKAADSEVVRRLRAAGAVIVGKTNTSELGQWPFSGGRAFGDARNPWDRSCTPGGSSGGSAAAVSAGLVSAALGSDGAGSVRIPASWTNLVGIKPQRGRISTWPDPEAFNGITVIGPLARTVADAALLLDVVSGAHAGDLHTPTPVSLFDSVGRDPGRLRIALSLRKPFIPTPSALDPEIAAAAYAMAHTLRELGHHVVVDDPDYGVLLGLGFLPRSLAGVGAWLDRLPGAVVDDRTRANARHGRALGGRALTAARWAERRSQERVGRIFDSYDVMLAPTTASPPPPVETIDGLSNADTDRAITRLCPYTWPWNVLGWPAVNVPAGFTSNGLPIGLQLMGHESTEPLLVSVAAQLEEANGWQRFRPERWW